MILGTWFVDLTLAAPALVAGRAVRGRYWFRVPRTSFGAGLSNGLAFQLGP